MLGIAHVVLLCLASALFGWFTAGHAIDLGYANGWAGTPGTIAEASCLTDGPVTCSAYFTASTPGASAQDVGITGSDDLDPGATYPATLQPDGDATVTGLKAAMETLAGLALFALTFVLGVGYGVLGLTQRLGRARGWWRWSPSRPLVLTPAIIAALFALIAGASALIAAHTTL